MATALTLNTADFDTGVNVTDAYEAAAASMYCTWDSKQTLLVNNDSGGDITVTIDNPKSCAFSVTPEDHDEVITCTDGKVTAIDLTPERFRNAEDSNRVNLTFSGTSSVTVCLIKFAGQL